MPVGRGISSGSGSDSWEITASFPSCFGTSRSDDDLAVPTGVRGSWGRGRSYLSSGETGDTGIASHTHSLRCRDSTCKCSVLKSTGITYLNWLLTPSRKQTPQGTGHESRRISGKGNVKSFRNEQRLHEVLVQF